MTEAHRRNGGFLLCSTSAFALLLASPAFAQTTPPTSNSDVSTVEEVVVTGTRASLSKALDIKRKTIGVVDSIAAEDIGKFPDQNVAESLQRITGVSIDRSGGEGKFITVRGFGPEFNTVLLNNRLLATENAGREFSFDILASELISGAEVYKSSSADQQEGGIGSTVIIRTARPLDRPGFHFAGSAAAKIDSTTDKATPVLSAVMSDTNEDRTFGALVSLVYDKRESRLSNVNTGGWIAGQNLDFNKDGVVDMANVAMPRTYNTTVEQNHRERLGGTLALDWVVNDKLKLGFDGLYTQFRVKSRSNQIGYYTDPGDVIAATANANHTVTSFTRSAAGNLATDQIVFDSPRDAKTFQVAFNAHYTPTDRSTLDVDLSHSEATDGNKSVFYVLGSRNTGLTPRFDLNAGGLPTMSDVLGTTDASGLRVHCCAERGGSVKDAVTQLNLDYKLEFDGALKSLKFGGLGTIRKKDIISLTSPDPLGCFYCGYLASAPASLTSVFHGGSILGGPDMNWLDYDVKKLVQYWGSDAAVNQRNDPAAEAAFRAVFAGNGNSLNPVYNPQGSGSVEEKNGALYAQAEFGGDRDGHAWSAVAGLRYIYTDLHAEGNSRQLISITPRPSDPTSADAAYSPPVPVTADNNYNYFLPSASFRYNITDDVVFRAAGSRTLTRPTLTNLSLAKSYDFRPPQSNTVSGGNPDLKPYLAWNGDVGLDWFISDASYVSIAGFYKKVTNFVSQVTTPVTYFGYQFLDTRPTNAEGAKIYGFEAAVQYTFDMLPAPFDGLGASANYTKVKSNISFDPTLSTQTFNVEGLSDSANLVLFYEKGPIQMRGAYNWRDKFLRHTFGANGQPENVDAYGQYDLSGSYKVTKNFAVFTEVINLTNRHSRSYSTYEERLIELDDTGRRVSVGVRATF
jgi:TonB-dependent receptor